MSRSSLDADTATEQTQELAEKIQGMPINVVESIRALNATELQQAAQLLHQHFLYANLAEFATKQAILAEIGERFMLPKYFGRNLDALYDCLTDTILHAGEQPGFVIVLEHIPTSIKFNPEMREQLLDVFRDAADFWAEHQIPFRCFYSFY